VLKIIKIIATTSIELRCTENNNTATEETFTMVDISILAPKKVQQFTVKKQKMPVEFVGSYG
jgi:hypothetical protein